jgi:hypothetical protein
MRFVWGILSELPSSEYDIVIRSFKRRQDRRTGAQCPEGSPTLTKVRYKNVLYFEETQWEKGQLWSVDTVPLVSQSNCTPVFQEGRANEDYHLQNFWDIIEEPIFQTVPFAAAENWKYDTLSPIRNCRQTGRGVFKRSVDMGIMN